MQTRHVPAIDRRYWSAILFASIFGTNMGDFYAHEAGLGLVHGALLLLIPFAATYAIEMKDRTATQIYYWLAIIIIRTGATNIADYLAFRIHIPPAPLTAGLAAAIALFGWAAAPRAQAANVSSPTLAKTGLAYWAAMLAAGVFGTAAGDIASHHFGQAPSAITLTVLLVALLVLAKNRVATSIAAYWCAVALARTAGTCIGDWCAENHLLHIGLPLSTLLTGTAFVAILSLWPTGARSARATA